MVSAADRGRWESRAADGAAGQCVRIWRQREAPCRLEQRTKPAAPDNSTVLNIFSPRLRRLSCGIVLLTEASEILLCHVTGQRHWDLPKGGIHPGESARQAALRETHEETGLHLAAAALLDLGRHAYTGRKDLHLFATLSARIDPRRMHCDSCFVERVSGRTRPEMDDFGWFAIARVETLCTPKLADLLATRLDLDAVVAALRAPSTALAA